MPRQCALTGKSVRFGHNVSHSNRKSSRRFAANIQKVSLQSEALGRTVRLPISTRALRTLQKRGGLDAFLLRAADEKLPPEALRLKRAIRKALS
jgi:large subunit ribosomal protein L28